ncbi:hypothetical protein SynA1528_01951 [Synechococcus sp. A15-28]|nr:hypothetical protein SynA1528_01951 [Synechococcus sp. A15-28]
MLRLGALSRLAIDGGRQRRDPTGSPTDPWSETAMARNLQYKFT